MKHINIAFCCDDAYIVPTKIMLESLLRNNKNVSIIAHTFSDDLSKKNVKVLSTMLEECGGKLKTYQVPKIAFETIGNAPTLSHISVATYYRLLLPYVVDETVKKVLYLDCDILIRNKIEGCYDIDLDEDIVAGVLDIHNEQFKKRLNVSEYINAGILLINMEKMRKQFTLLQILETMNHLMETLDLPMCDQDLINVMFENQICLLPQEFNYQYVIKKKYVLKNMKEAKKAIIVHFITSDKPWKGTYVFPYLWEYYKYLRKYLSIKEKLNYWFLKPKGIVEGLKEHTKYMEEHKQ